MKKSYLSFLVVFLYLFLISSQGLFSQELISNDKVGAQLPSTGTQQPSPQVVSIASVAPDVLCIEVDACRILPSIQIPYQADPGDVVKVINFSAMPLHEDNTIRVERNGFPLGMLVGKERKILTIYERIIGKHLNTVVADNPMNYSISSLTDRQYIKKTTPLSIRRKSKPTNWTEENRSNGQFYTTKHFIYLKMPYAMKEGHSYLIQMPALELDNSSYYCVYDPRFVRSEAVHVSQIGFRPDDPVKSAYLSLWMGNGGGFTYPDNLSFSLINDSTNEVVFTGKSVIVWKGDVPEGVGSKVNHSATDVSRLDFSSFSVPGRYHLYVQGVGCSYPFVINNYDSWENAFKISMKGNFHQRSGIAMLPPYTDFVRPRSFNPIDGVKVYASTCTLTNSRNGLNALGNDKDNFGNLVAGKTNEIVPNAWGGNMDAGDWDRRINHLYTTRLLLELVEFNPDYFKGLALNIPESGNDLPDVVDEAIFQLEVYRRMQTPEGGIRGGIESSEHPAQGSTSWEETLTVLAYAPDPWSSFMYAGVAARLSIVLKNSDKKELSEIWAKSAVKAMVWGEQEYKVWVAGTEYSTLVSSGAKTRVASDRNLAAIELYRLTKDKNWHQIYLNTKDISSTDADFVYSRLEKELADADVQQKAIKNILDRANRLIENAKLGAYSLSTGVPDRALGGWGATYSLPASSTLARAHFLTKDVKYLKAIISSSLFSSGANPMNLCLTTGLGQNSVQHPLHEDSRHTGQPSPIGYTVFGPGEVNSYVSRFPTANTRLAAECTPGVTSWPSAESYFDIYGWDIQNEFVVETLGNSAYIWGYLASRNRLSTEVK